MNRTQQSRRYSFIIYNHQLQLEQIMSMLWCFMLQENLGLNMFCYDVSNTTEICVHYSYAVPLNSFQVQLLMCTYSALTDCVKNVFFKAASSFTNHVVYFSLARWLSAGVYFCSSHTPSLCIWTAARGQNALHTPHCLDPIQKGRAAFCSDICTMQPVATWLTES